VLLLSRFISRHFCDCAFRLTATCISRFKVGTVPVGPLGAVLHPLAKDDLGMYCQIKSRKSDVIMQRNRRVILKTWHMSKPLYLSVPSCVTRSSVAGINNTQHLMLSITAGGSHVALTQHALCGGKTPLNSNAHQTLSLILNLSSPGCPGANPKDHTSLGFFSAYSSAAQKERLSRLNRGLFTHVGVSQRLFDLIH
jgi:hypothetical protein